MPISLNITAESVAEFDHLLSRFIMPGRTFRGSTAAEASISDDNSEDQEEEQPAAPLASTNEKPKTTRQRRTAREPAASEGIAASSAQADTQENGSQTSDNGQTATKDASPSDEEHPLLVPKSLADIKAKASEIMGAKPTAGAEIMAKLNEQFSVRAFSALKSEDFDRCYAMLESL